jgi:hypothetical protein
MKELAMRLLSAARRRVVVGVVVAITAALAGVPSASSAADGGSGLSGLVDSMTPLSNGYVKHVYYENGREVARLLAEAGAVLEISDAGTSLTATVVGSIAGPTTDAAAAAARARLMGYKSDDLAKVMKESDAGSMPNGRPNPNPVQTRVLPPLAGTDAAVSSNTPPCAAGVLEITGLSWGEAHSGWERWCLTDSDPYHRYSIENNHATAWSKGIWNLDEIRLGNYYTWGVPYQWNPGSTYTTGSCHTGYFEISGGTPLANATVHTDFHFCPDRVKFASADQTTPDTHMTGAWEGWQPSDNPTELVVQTKEYVANSLYSGYHSQLYIEAAHW